MSRLSYLFLIVFLFGYSAKAEEATVEMFKVTTSGNGERIGTLSLKDSQSGLIIMPNLRGLPPGDHGFHVHVNPDCSPKEKDGKLEAAEAAGPHYDPSNSGKHLGPKGAGHHGDLPTLKVSTSGDATGDLTAPQLQLSKVRGRAFIIHEGGDNYSDSPKPLGGGGARIACGVLP